jgi:hypothetical protein
VSTLIVLIAQAETHVPPSPPLFVVLVPWLFCGIMMGSVLALISKRKGKNPVLWFFLGFIPLVGFFLAFILASRPDVALLDRIHRLEEQLASPAPKSSGIPPPPPI